MNGSAKWESVKRLFGEALDLPPGERTAFLKRACKADEVLRAEIESLLHEHDAETGAGPTLNGRAAAVIDGETPGTLVGPYKLLQRIGEGGFGSVYMADQEAPVRRRVALKIIKLGMDTRQVIARFEAERQALALMDHPGIARVLDGGATDKGRPYFVMELVRGDPVTRYCDEQKLTVQARLELFTQVCRAVQHAHQKGVIHRDLKPSNVLATTVDDRPAIKVIDFGIAKATDQRLTDKTLFTEFQQMIGTPQYMSPEQSAGSLDIDTRSDVYSLGVILYELLTGTTPFEPRELRSASREEMQRIIREVEPDKPSQRIGLLASARASNPDDSDAVRFKTPAFAPASTTSAAVIAQFRKTDASALRRQLRGELDWIVMKAMEKDRVRRYESVGELAADVERYLANEPVSAGPPEAGYRLRKFAQRHAGLLTAVCIVAAVVLLGGIGTTVGMIRAWRAEKLATDRLAEAQIARQAESQARLEEKRQKEEAEQSEKTARSEADKRDQVAKFLEEMMQGVGPGVARGRDTTLLREILQQTEQRLASELPDQPEVEGELRGVIAEVYYDLAMHDEAEANLRRALELFQGYYGRPHADIATLLNSLGKTLQDRGDLDEAEKYLLQAYEMRKMLLGDDNADVAISLRYLGEQYRMMGKFDRAERYLRDSMEMTRKHLGENDLRYAGNLNDLGLVLLDQGKYADAVTVLRDAVDRHRAIVGGDHPLLASALSNLSSALNLVGKPQEAEPFARESLEMRRRLLGEDHVVTAASKGALALILNTLGRLDEGEQLLREQIATLEKNLGPDALDLGAPHANLGAYLSDQGKGAEAIPHFEQALAIFRKRLGPRHPRVGQSLAMMVQSLMLQEKYAEAEAPAREQLALEAEALPPGHPNTAGCKSALAGVILELFWPALPDGDRAVLAARAKEAEALVRSGLGIRERSLPPEHWIVFNTRNLLGGAISAVGAASDDPGEAVSRFQEAEPLLLDGYQGVVDHVDGVPPQYRKRVLRKSIDRIVHLYESWDEVAPDTGLAEKAADWRERNVSNEDSASP